MHWGLGPCLHHVLLPAGDGSSIGRDPSACHLLGAVCAVGMGHGGQERFSTSDTAAFTASTAVYTADTAVIAADTAVITADTAVITASTME